MNIYEVLHKDHLAVAALIDKLEKQCAKNDDDAVDTFRKIKTAFTEHADGEESLFYPVIAKAGNEELIQRARSQHDAIRSMLQRIEAVIDTRREQVQPLVLDLKTRVTEHVNLEEGEIFQRAHQAIIGDQEDRIGDDMLRAEPDVHPLRAKIAEFKEDHMRT